MEKREKWNKMAIYAVKERKYRSESYIVGCADPENIPLDTEILALSLFERKLSAFKIVQF